MSRDFVELGWSSEPPTKTWANGPRPEVAAIISRTIEHMKSVPYQVSLRWLFYRLLQEGALTGKGSYKSYTGVIAKARHSGLIRPDAIADEGRQEIRLSGVWGSVEDWTVNLAKQMRDGFSVVDLMQHHDPYVIVAFEAKAMSSQFQTYARPYGVRLYPFGGDPSIPFKWELSELVIDGLSTGDVALLYFGDLDPKGESIAESAIRDVRKFTIWQLSANLGISTEGEFSAYHVGLTAEQAVDFDLPENPDKPGEYQWEALSDGQAAQLITGALDQFVDLEALAEIRESEREALSETADLLEGISDEHH